MPASKKAYALPMISPCQHYSAFGSFIIWLVVMQMIHPNPDIKREEICITSVAGFLFGGMTLVPFVKLLIEVFLQCWKSVPSLLPRRANLAKVTPFST
nr:hypothetical protein CFP56_22975 [Quercus suber]